MPSPGFFVQRGLFVRRHFLDPECCRRLTAEMSDAPSEPGRLLKDGVDHILDETTRKVSSAAVCKATRTDIKQRFSAITPELEAHFGTPLAGCETPGFLIYDVESFFAPHTDAGPDDPAGIGRRLVSAIVFLNQQSTGQSNDGYRGGTLRFHGLLDGPQWAACPLPFESEPGMLVAFRSRVMHEVQTVTSGRRFTVVTWYPVRSNDE